MFISSTSEEGLGKEGRLNRGLTVCEYWQHKQGDHRKTVMSQKHHNTGFPMISSCWLQVSGCW